MAYIKYKELTKRFYFHKSLDEALLPKYVMDYVEPGEKVLRAYATMRDKGIFTTKKIVLFDKIGIGKNKCINMIPLLSISMISAIYKGTEAELVIYLDCGYPIRLCFRNQKPEDKTEIRKIHSYIVEYIVKNSR